MIYFGVLQKSGFVSRRLNLKLYFDNVMFLCVCEFVCVFVCKRERESERERERERVRGGEG